jgi:hypothetical protein
VDVDSAAVDSAGAVEAASELWALPPQAASEAAIAEAIKSATIFFICVFLLSVISMSGFHPFRGDLSVVLFTSFINYYIAHHFSNIVIHRFFGTTSDFRV